MEGSSKTAAFVRSVSAPTYGGLMSAGLYSLSSMLWLRDKCGDTSARIKKQPSEDRCELQTIDCHFCQLKSGIN